LLWWKI